MIGMIGRRIVNQKPIDWGPNAAAVARVMTAKDASLKTAQAT